MQIYRGGRVIDPGRNIDGIADVLVERGKIVRIGPAGAIAEQPGVEIIDIGGKWLTPGFIDLHVHLREPGSVYKEDIASGLKAAAAGGFTTVCAMANTNPVNDNALITKMMMERAAAVGGTHLRVFGAMTRGLAGKELADAGGMREAGAIGVSDDGLCVMNAAVMRNVMKYARTFDLLVSQHCEDHCLTAGAQMNEGRMSTKLGLRGWPKEAEDIIVARDIILAEASGCRYHVAHISSKNAVQWVREAKSRGLSVSAEVTPHHLSLTEDNVVGYNTHCKVNPPLRTAEDRDAMIAALVDGSIDCIATDHAPHNVSVDKHHEFRGASLGINGLESAIGVLLELVHAKRLSPMRFVDALTKSAARLIPDADIGSLKDGHPADMTILDPDLEWTFAAPEMRSKSHNTPFMGKTFRGAIDRTIVGGDIVYQRGNIASNDMAQHGEDA